MYNQRPIVITHKSSGFPVWKWVGVFAALCAIPFLCLLIVPLGCIGGIAAVMGAFLAVQNYGWWAVGALLAIPIILASRDRISGKHEVKALRSRIIELETELVNTRHQILLLEDEREFTRKLESSKACKNPNKILDFILDRHNFAINLSYS